jgi:hypothetical protein
MTAPLSPEVMVRNAMASVTRALMDMGWDRARAEAQARQCAGLSPSLASNLKQDQVPQ